MSEKILIVEDEFIVANDLRLILQRAGYNVIGIANSVSEALEIIDANKPQLVLLDIYLKGDLTGIDLAKKLAEEHIAYVYLSANSNQKVLEEAKATQPYGFLVKPFREKDILVTLDIARYRHNNSLESKLRKEVLLQNLLTSIIAKPFGWKQKLMEIAKSLQAYIPFDYWVISVHLNKENKCRYCSFLRIGFDEYQIITKDELETITGFNSTQIKNILSQSLTQKSSLNNNKDFIKACSNNLFFAQVSEIFSLNASLQYPLKFKEGIPMSISFFSKRNDTYNSNHMLLLTHLEYLLQTTLNSVLTSELGDYTSATQKEAKDTRQNFEGIIGRSHLLLNVLDNVQMVAPLDTSVLILGESGTGKEKIAQAIHNLSPRKSKTLVKLNCASLPANLIESELFGHEKGAFTGALEKRIGKFEQANGGTIFLDEIGEMPIELQVKLLRVLQEKEIERLGGKETIKIDVRIVTATNRNLEKEVADGNFRLDLYYRLNVFPVELPPLRDRKEDISALADHFADKFSKKMNRQFVGLSEKMLDELEAYNWPGNIRELENVIEQTVILTKPNELLTLKRPLSNPLMSTSNHSESTTIKNLTDVKKIQEETEKDYIISVLKKTYGRIRGRGGAAEILNLKPTTLESRMAKLGIKKDDLF
ncbi:MAG: DNA-binding response regulator [Thalassobius sp.]|nr:DNA-binding response regulator [Thalassovita sp.]